MRLKLHSNSLRRIRGPALWIAYGVAAIALGAGGMYLIGQLRGSVPAGRDQGVVQGIDQEHGDEEKHGEDENVNLPRSQWESAGLRINRSGEGR